MKLDGVVDMDVGYETNRTRAKSNSHAVLFIYLILYYTVKSVKLDVSCSLCNFTERDNLV